MITLVKIMFISRCEYEYNILRIYCLFFILNVSYVLYNKRLKRPNRKKLELQFSNSAIVLSRYYNRARWN